MPAENRKISESGAFSAGDTGREDGGIYNTGLSLSADTKYGLIVKITAAGKVAAGQAGAHGVLIRGGQDIGSDSNGLPDKGKSGAAANVRYRGFTYVSCNSTTGPTVHGVNYVDATGKLTATSSSNKVFYGDVVAVSGSLALVRLTGVTPVAAA